MQYEVLSAGCPCVPFSDAGIHGGARDPRGTVINFLARYIPRHSPKLSPSKRGFGDITILREGVVEVRRVGGAERAVGGARDAQGAVDQGRDRFAHAGNGRTRRDPPRAWHVARRMKPLILASVVTFSLCLPALAHAQPQRPAPSQEFTFGDQLVQSELPRPDERTVRPGLLRTRRPRRGRCGACTVTDAFVLSLKRVLRWVPLTRGLPLVVPS